VDRVPLVIVGSGPAGLAAAAQAARRGMKFVMLERSAHFADTIQNFAKGKLVMSTPKRLPLQPGLALSFEEGPVERVLETWRKEADAAGALKRLRIASEVISIARDGGAFRLEFARGDTLGAENVVLAMGTQGNITKLAVPGAERVRYQLRDASEFVDADITVVGSGDTAIENALALAEQNRVTMVVRGRAFKPEKVTVANLAAIEAAIRDGRVSCRYDAETVRVESDRVTLRVAGREEFVPCEHIIARIGSAKPRKFLEACGVAFECPGDDADPALDPHYQSAVPGLYVVGSLAGYPLIKHCLNQGFEVVEHIAGTPVAPADAPALAETFASLTKKRDIEGALQKISRTIPLFAGLTRLALGDVLLDSRLVRRKTGETVVRRGEYGDSIFAILDGAVGVEVQPDVLTMKRILHKGEFFGEMGLISGRPRSATVRAVENATLIEVPRRAALKLFGSVPQARTRIDEAMTPRQIRAYISEDLAGADLDELVAAAKPVSFAYGETILASGAPTADVLLLQSGSAKATCRSWGREIVLRYLPAGQMVGEYAHLSDRPPQLSVVAATKTAAIRIDGDVFARVLARNPALKARLKARMEHELRENASTIAQPGGSGVIGNFLAEGVGEATNILVIDEALCTRCDNCESACAETHGGISRLNRESGPTYATLHVPTSCRHCEQPQCMTDCPADAIHRALNGEVYIDPESCIGCGACERSCPYHVIRMAAAPAPKPNLLLWLLFGWGSGPGEDRSLKADELHTGHKHAVKCDMCQGRNGGPACVSACPTGAAMRVDPKSFLEIARGVPA
jgi:thioredoxin reductase/Fe-S-cluster-containing hydrogenase component 2/CRP-like cAMP-binding protein